MTLPDPHVHTEREDHSWTVEIPDHPGRTESPGFRRAKSAAHKILIAVHGQPGSAMLAFLADSPQPPQAHHAGSLWVHDAARRILAEPVTDAASVARWTDSLFNACVMLSPALHTGVVSGVAQAGGWHHYPKSVWDQQVTKRDDFTLWVTGGDGLEAAVSPVAPPGSGDGRVQVLYARPGSELHRQQQEAHAAGKPHILDADHPQAFAGQEGA